MVEPEKKDIYDLTREELGEELMRRFALPPYRAKQIYDWLYRRRVSDFAAMVNISRVVREQLPQVFKAEGARVLETRSAADGTRKYVWEVSPGVEVESVLIAQPGRNTLCVSTQQGCAMGCVFCRTAQMGLLSNLSAGDILRQVLGVLGDGRETTLSNLVFMGMGEPLHNLQAVFRAVSILGDPYGLGFGPRKITISTSGFVPGIEALGKSGLDVRLAVSLNAVTNELRSRLMPINRSYPLEVLIPALRRFPLGPRKRITIEYILIDGVNDSDQDLEGLFSLLQGVRAKLNLIPYNPTPNLPFRTAPRERLESWRLNLQRRGLQTNIRWSKGAEIDGACGQLALSRKENG